MLYKLLLQKLSNKFFKALTDEEFTMLLGSSFQLLITLIVKKLCLDLQEARVLNNSVIIMSSC